MHGKIFQISAEPISREDYVSPDDFYENSSNFADYIGEEVKVYERKNYVGYLAHDLRGVFTAVGRDHLVYLGDDALRKFLQEWADKIKAQAAELTADNILNGMRLTKISLTTKETHRDSDYRVYIDEWNGYAGPLADLIGYAANKLKKGDSIYIGAVIDYHY